MADERDIILMHNSDSDVFLSFEVPSLPIGLQNQKVNKQEAQLFLWWPIVLHAALQLAKKHTIAWFLL